ncbi:hypothetical protein BT69DRAFT_442959 [Atractiella rhizophila]|nr:hypothetical protein BT69DRAFT_442959 [Atractiella rhizophila]
MPRLVCARYAHDQGSTQEQCETAIAFLSEAWELRALRCFVCIIKGSPRPWTVLRINNSESTHQLERKKRFHILHSNRKLGWRVSRPMLPLSVHIDCSETLSYSDFIHQIVSPAHYFAEEAVK